MTFVLTKYVYSNVLKLVYCKYTGLQGASCNVYVHMDPYMHKVFITFTICNIPGKTRVYCMTYIYSA